MWFMLHNAEMQEKMIHTNWFLGFFYGLSFTCTFIIPMYKLLKNDYKRRHLYVVR